MDFFINNVRKVIDDRGITADELAQKCGFTTETMRRLLNKKIITLRLDMAVTIADALDISLDELCREKRN